LSNLPGLVSIEDMKKCTKCLVQLPLSHFNNNKRAKDGKQYACRHCARASARRWRHENPEMVEANRRREREAKRGRETALGREKVNKYQREWKRANPEKVRGYAHSQHLKRCGLTPEGYQALLEAQGNCCRMCGTADWGNKHGTPTIDVDPATGKVRGLLCRGCHTTLAAFGGDLSNLLCILKYQLKHGMVLTPEVQAALLARLT